MMVSTISHQASQIAGSESGQVEFKDMHLPCSVFWNAKEVIFVDMLKPLTQICTFKLLKPCKSISGEVSQKNVVGILLRHDNAGPHTSLRAQEVITKLQWTVLDHPPHILLPQICGVLKDSICVKMFWSDDEVNEDVKKYMAVSTIFKLKRDRSFAPCQH